MSDLTQRRRERRGSAETFSKKEAGIPNPVKLTQRPFGQTPYGDAALYTFANDNGLEVSITNYGGAITSIIVPDRSGNPGDVVFGYETVEEYVKHPRFMGALIGRQKAGVNRPSLPVRFWECTDWPPTKRKHNRTQAK